MGIILHSGEKKYISGSLADLAYPNARDFPSWYDPARMNEAGYGVLIGSFMFVVFLLYIKTYEDSKFREEEEVLHWPFKMSTLRSDMEKYIKYDNIAVRLSKARCLADVFNIIFCENKTIALDQLRQKKYGMEIFLKEHKLGH